MIALSIQVLVFTLHTNCFVYTLQGLHAYLLSFIKTIKRDIVQLLIFYRYLLIYDMIIVVDLSFCQGNN